MKLRERKNLQRIYNAIRYGKPVTFNYLATYSNEPHQQPVVMILQDGLSPKGGRYPLDAKEIKFTAINLKRIAYGTSVSDAVRTYKLSQIIGNIKVLR